MTGCAACIVTSSYKNPRLLCYISTTHSATFAAYHSSPPPLSVLAVLLSSQRSLSLSLSLSLSPARWLLRLSSGCVDRALVGGPKRLTRSTLVASYYDYMMYRLDQEAETTAFVACIQAPISGAVRKHATPRIERSQILGLQTTVECSHCSFGLARCQPNCKAKSPMWIDSFALLPWFPRNRGAETKEDFSACSLRRLPDAEGMINGCAWWRCATASYVCDSKNAGNLGETEYVARYVTGSVTPKDS
jgi:hypothetical protein